eukprot:1012671_1
MVTQMFRILIYLVIGALFWSNASNEVIEFGFKTGNHSWHRTPHMVTLTLWSESTIYQVSTTAGQSGQTSTWFNFSIHQDPYFHVLGRHCSNITQTKMMIELDNPDAVCIDQVKIVTQSGVWYGIEQFYIRNTLKDLFCIDNDQYPPSKQIIYFDTTRPNQYINDAAWSNGTNVDPRSNTYQCDPIPRTQFTPMHGDPGGYSYFALNLGRVYAMLDWSLAGNKYLQIWQWKSDLQFINNTIYGSGTGRSLCTPFTLSSDDYITGYHIWFDTTGVSGLKLFTHNDLTFSCIGINNSNTTSYSNTYDYGPFNFSYLTGWNVRA